MKYAITVESKTDAPNRNDARVFLPCRFNSKAEAQDEMLRLSSVVTCFVFYIVEIKG